MKHATGWAGQASEIKMAWVLSPTYATLCREKSIAAVPSPFARVLVRDFRNRDFAGPLWGKGGVRTAEWCVGQKHVEV